MFSWIDCILVVIGSINPAALPAPAGYLYDPAYCLDSALRGTPRPYIPQPGDIMLPTDRSIFWTITHNLALTGNPHHSGIVFAMPDGSCRILESGPHNSLHVEVMPVASNLRTYEEEGRVWMRQRRNPLTAEQSACLTRFALAQEGKRFAAMRLAAQVTPLKSRGPIKIHFLGGPHGERSSYFCSELVTEACVAGGLLDPRWTRPACTYPRELFFDHSPNPFLNRHFSLAPDWYPPARWLSELPRRSSEAQCVREEAHSTETPALYPR